MLLKLQSRCIQQLQLSNTATRQKLRKLLVKCNYTLTRYILTYSIGGLKEIRSCVAVYGPSTAIRANSPCFATALEGASFSFIYSLRRLVSISMGATPSSTKTHLKFPHKIGISS